MAEVEGASPIEVPVGGTFVISLPSIPSTGFTWDVDFEAASLALLRSNDLRGVGDGVGAGGDEEFEFQALAPGATTVRLRYQRPWSSTTKETRVYEVVVTP